MSKHKEEASNRRGSSLVDELLSHIDAMGWNVDDYLWRTKTYLDLARHCGLGSPQIVDSCIDLAATLTDIPEVSTKRAEKVAAWEERLRIAQAVDRPSRTIDMELAFSF